MPIRSNVDPILFIRTMHILQEKISPDIIEKIKTAGQDKQLQYDLFAGQYNSNPRIFFHEIYHFWQGLRLPFLFRYAFICYYKIFLAFKEGSINFTDLHSWDFILPEFYLLDSKSKIFIHDKDNLLWGSANAVVEDAVSVVELSAIDLLESATSLAEYQVSRTDRSEIYNPVHFSRWIKRNPAYLESLKFVIKYLEDEVLAYRIFIALVNTAFHTSEPVKAFTELLFNFKALNYRSRYEIYINQPEPTNWKAVFENILDNNIEFNEEPDIGTQILRPKYQKLTLDYWVYSTYYNGSNHPFISDIAKKWIEKANSNEKHNAVFKWIIYNPAYADTETFLYLMEKFTPLTFVKFYGDNSNTIISLWNEATINIFKKDEKLGLIELLLVYSVVRKASGVHFDEDHRLCDHKECPEYKHNYCNTFPKIPEDFKDCTFLKRFNTLINYFNLKKQHL